MQFLKIDDLVSEKMKTYAPIIVRIAISFLWFGKEQLMNAEAWTGLIPESVISISGMSALSFVYSNAISEIIFGILLLVGFFTRLSAIFLALKLFGIMFIIGYNDVGVRDFGLAMATLSIFLYGADAWCLDKFLEKKNTTSSTL